MWVYNVHVTCVCVQMFAPVCLFACMHVCLLVCVLVCLCACMLVCLCVCQHVCKTKWLNIYLRDAVTHSIPEINVRRSPGGSCVLLKGA